MTFTGLGEYLNLKKIPYLQLNNTPSKPTEEKDEILPKMLGDMVDGIMKVFDERALGWKYPNVLYLGMDSARYPKDHYVVWIICQVGDETALVYRVGCSKSEDPFVAKILDEITGTIQNVADSVTDRIERKGYCSFELPGAIPLYLSKDLLEKDQG